MSELKWSTLPEAELPIIRDLISLVESQDPPLENSFFKDKTNIHKLIEELILVHRKAGLDSPLLKFKRDEKRKQLFEEDDPDWEKKLKKALGETALKDALMGPGAKPPLPSIPALKGPLADKLKLLSPEPPRHSGSRNESLKIFLILIICGFVIGAFLLSLMK